MTKLGSTLICLLVATVATSQTGFAQSTRRPSPARTRAAPPPAKPLVVVLPADDTPGDSVRAIVHRDLDYGDRLTPLSIDPALLRPMLPMDGIVNYDFFAGLKASAIVAPRRTATGYRVAVYAVATRLTLQEAEFAVPEVPELRAQQIQDSLVLDHGVRDSVTSAAIVRVTVVRDSLLLASRARPPRNRKKAAAERAVRDSLLLITAREDSVLRERRVRDIAERDSLIPVLIARDLVRRDSLVLARRFAIHGIADEVQRWITGFGGMAQSRVVYVHNGQLRVVDSDGANDRPLTAGGSALSPSWHPSGTRVVFSDFNDLGTQIAEVDLGTGNLRLIAATPRGLNLTPVYTRDGRSVVYAYGKDAGSDLVIASLEDSVPARRIALAGDVDRSSPSFSPDGATLTFISPRSWQGTRMTPQLFTIRLDGSEEKQLTPSVRGVRTYRTSPDWSPDGQRVAYMQQAGDFQVWLINVRTQQMKRITNMAENEDPTWAPDSRHIAVASNRGGTKEIWVLDVDSGRMRQLTNSPGARLPAWSPIVKPEMAAKFAPVRVTQGAK